MNNKGFTVIELLASFVLTMTIVVFLFEIVLELRNIYTNESEKSEVINTNALVATAINDILSADSIADISCSSDMCTINFMASQTRVISVNASARTVSVDGQIFEYPLGSTIENLDLQSVGINTDVDANNSFIKIGYEIDTPNVDKNIEFNYVYPYRAG